MKTLPPPIAKILAGHVIANERVLECDWDQRGAAAVKHVQDIVARAHMIARVGTTKARLDMTEEMFRLWDDNLAQFNDSSDGDSKCLATRSIRAVCVSLLCLGVEGDKQVRFDGLYAKTVNIISALLDSPGKTPSHYLFNMRKRLESLQDMTAYAEGRLPGGLQQKETSIAELMGSEMLVPV